MSISFPSKKKGTRGFTLIEVMVATFVLAIGLVSVAALATTMLATGKRSKYMALASSLASEKLEDLSRYPADDPNVCVPTGNTSVGSLTTSVLQTTTCSGGTSASVPYYDDVDISFGNSSSDCPSTGGCFAETISAVNNGTTQYTTTYHSPDGHLTATTSSTKSTQTFTFHRSWLIEANTPVTGVRRVTVLITLENSAVNPPVTFQMSSVRP